MARWRSAIRRAPRDGRPGQSLRQVGVEALRLFGLGAVAGDDDRLGGEAGEARHRGRGRDAPGERLGPDLGEKRLEGRRGRPRFLRAALGSQQTDDRQAGEQRRGDGGDACALVQHPRAEFLNPSRHSSSCFISPRSAFDAAMILACRCDGTSS